jgi:hypothetical protein
METIGFQYNMIPTVDWHHMNAYPDMNPPLKTLWDHHESDKFLKFGNSSFLLKTQLFFPNLLNPSFVFWNNNIVVSWRKEAGSIRIVFIKVPKKYDSIGSTVSDYIQVFQQFNFLEDSLPHVDFDGEDPRLFVTDGNSDGNQRLWVAYCMRHRRSRPELWMGYSEIFLKQGESITLQQDTVININFKLESMAEQKNWSPFYTRPLSSEKPKMLFIGSMDPHRIIHTVPTKFKQHVYGETG